ncbi:MAG: UPF0175 family protein [Leptospiraceae bacterium]|nr:UPF0175 family protein [Leptospiraceae bacterium]MCP5494566.1 UPF0175 family protein [Leptospiraceae bacterium]
MLSININVPETLLLKWDCSKEKLREETQKLIAIKFFELGFLTTGQAAEMCGMNRIDFMIELSSLGIPIVRMEKEEIQKEIEKAKSL